MALAKFQISIGIIRKKVDTFSFFNYDDEKNSVKADLPDQVESIRRDVFELDR